LELVKRAGIRCHEKKQDQLFCNESSGQILAKLLRECKGAGLRISGGCETARVETGPGFQLVTGQGCFSAGNPVIAYEGLSIPKMGGPVFGYDIDREFGL
jgi:Predicted flavoproteins